MPERPGPVPDVLLVMPDTRLRALISAQLQEEGYDVLPVSSLVQAFRLLQRGVIPRLVIIDTHGLSEYGEDILALARMTLSPVLLLTSAMQPNPIPEDKLKVHPHLAILARPFAISDLVQNVNTLTRKPRRRGPHVSTNDSA
ncbi:MAG: DNA-binding response regulator [Nitrospirae bacterium]|nr:MAG: DNA-binding response regulator [Nitrospirota bacterium]